MRQVIGNLGWSMVKWGFGLVTHDKDVLYAYVPLPPGFVFGEVQEIEKGGFKAKSVQLVREGLVLAPVEEKPKAGHYF